MDKCEYATLSMDKVLIAASTATPLAYLRRATLEAHVAAMSQDLVLIMESYVHGLEAEHIIISQQWPKDWWEAVKDRWFPAWFLRRWPVRWDVLDVNEKRYAAVCPHIHEECEGTHVKWLLEKQEERNGS